MMMPTHLAAGLFSGAGAVAWLQVPPVPTVWLLLGALIGALLPDIDHPKSWLGRRLPLLSLPLSAIFGHRGITHSLLAVVGVVWALQQALTQWNAIHHGHWHWVGVGVAVGYLSHLLGDFATHGGVPWLWPFKKRFSLPLTFRSGSWFERMLFFAFGTGTLYLLILRFAPWALHDALALWQQFSA
jgi:inner membrane protein